MEPTFFPDGYTRTGYVAASPGLHGAVSFTYRPATFPQRQKALTRNDRETPEQVVAKTVNLLAGKVLSWDIVHPETGEAVAIDAKTLPHVATAILLKMECIVLGVLPSDDNPDGPTGAEESANDEKN